MSLSSPRNAGGVGAWLTLMRVSNSPTVVTNVLAGIAVGLQARLSTIDVPLGQTLLVLFGIVLVYLAGMVLNDAFDARIDARERPGRPIPSGRISVGRAMVAGFAMLGIGTATLAVASPATAWWALALAAFVVLYDLLHALVPGGFLLMAACRALVFVIAALATSTGTDWAILQWVAGGAFAYVAAVSLAARDEVRGFGLLARRASWALPVAACAPLGMWFAEGVAPDGALSATLGVGAIAFAVVSVVGGIRTARNGAARFAVPAAVGSWIGAIPLVDAATCFLLGRPLLGLLCLGLWGMAGALRPRFAAS
jgi:4-hydroxybenzoate polyprenyltransferase